MARHTTDIQPNDIQRENVEGLRNSLKKLGVVVAEVDRGLRYVWIDNPHPDFDPKVVVGKRDDELIPADEAAPIMSLKKEAFDSKSAMNTTLSFRRSEGLRYYSLFAYPIRGPNGRVEGVLTVGFDVSPSEAIRNV